MAVNLIESRVRASYTIEAAYIMSMVIVTMMFVIIFAFQLHDKTAGAMAVHEMTELVRHEEREWFGETEKETRLDRTSVRPVYLKDRYEIRVETQDKIVRAAGEGMDWRLEIQAERYDPENFLRLLSLAEDGLLQNRR